MANWMGILFLRNYNFYLLQFVSSLKTAIYSLTVWHRIHLPPKTTNRTGRNMCLFTHRFFTECHKILEEKKVMLYVQV